MKTFLDTPSTVALLQRLLATSTVRQQCVAHIGRHTQQRV